MDFNLYGKTALITGGSHGLGKAVCLALAAEGTSVAVNYRRNSEQAWETVREIERTYGTAALPVRGDVTVENDVIRMFSEAGERFSGIDILVNNSGICPVSMVADMSLEEWEDVIRTNLTGVFLASREMVRMLRRLDRRGSIVNIASQSAFNGSKTGKSHYAASKGGVVSFTLSLAKETAPFGIRVNAVAPGMMYTGMTAGTLDANMEAYNASIPLGRIASVEEVARAAVFLASDVSSYITGTTLDVSGGITGR